MRSGCSTGEVGNDLILKENQFKSLRDKLLKGANDFYGKLDKLLEGQTDPASRKSLGQLRTFDLGELTEKIGDLPKAMESIRKSLTIRRELAALSPTDVDIEIRGHAELCSYLPTCFRNAGKYDEAMDSFQQAQALLKGLSPSETVSDRDRALIGRVYNGIGSDPDGRLAKRTGRLEFVQVRRWWCCRSWPTLTPRSTNFAPDCRTATSLSRYYCSKPANCPRRLRVTP